MTANTQPVAERPDPRAFGLPVVEQDQIPAELRHLASRVHDLIDAVANTEADPDTLAEAAATVDGLTEKLNAARHQIGTMVEREGDFTTLTNMVDSETNPTAPPLVLKRGPEGVSGQVTLNSIYQGPPGHVHGGWIAALLDQAVGSASHLETRPGLTAKLEVAYRRPTPLFTPLEVTGRVDRVEGRKVSVSGRVYANGELTAEASAVMIHVALPEDQG